MRRFQVVVQRTLITALIILSFFCFAGFEAVAQTATTATRTWTDSTGKYKIKASFVRMEGDKVFIKKEDGKTVSFALDKLSKKDQDYVESLDVGNPFAGEDENEDDNPFAGGSSSKTSTSPDRRVSAAEKRQELERRMSGGRSSSASRNSRTSSSRPGRGTSLNIDLPDGDAFNAEPKTVYTRKAPEGGGASRKSETCEPDPSTRESQDFNPRNLSFDLGGRLPSGVWARDAGFAVFNNKGKAAAIYAMNIDIREKPEECRGVVFFGDPVRGKVDGAQYLQKIELFGVSPDGSKALFREEGWGSSTHGTMNFVHIVGIDGMKLTPIASYYPFAADSQPDRMHNWDIDVTWGDWIDNNLIMLVSRKDRLLVMEAETGKAVWKLNSISHGASVAFSPGRRYCLVNGRAGTVMLESVNGRPVLKLEGTESFSGGNYEFSPDGTKIARCNSDGVTIWNATEGTCEDPFYVGDGIGDKIHWIDNRFLLAGSRLVDTETQSLVWTYDGIPDSAEIFDGFCWCLLGMSETKRLIAVEIPHKKALASASGPDEQRFSIRPGMDVAVNVDNSVQNGRNEVKEKIESILTENGLVIKEDAPIKVLLRVTQEKEVTSSYSVGHRFAPPMMRGGGTEIRYQPCKFSIEFNQNGKTLWSTSRTTSSPSNISLEEVQGNSIQAIVDKAMANANSAYKDWFLNVKIPKKIPNMERAGRSRVTESGIQDMR